MGEQQQQSGLKVGVAIYKPTSNLWIELGEMIIDGLSASGVLPSLVGDGDQEALETDVLILVGDASGFEGYAKLLARREGRKPTTILWQMEPLPPPMLSEDAERIGLRATKMSNRVKLPPGRFSRLIRSIVPLSARTKVREVIDGALFHGFNNEMAKCPNQEFIELDAPSRRIMMRRYMDLKHHLLEGWLNYVHVCGAQQKEFLANRGIPAKLTPFGYHPRIGENLGMERDIDVIFIGQAETARRKTILKALRGDLASKGLNLMTVGHGCYGKQRTELLNRAHISLNLVSVPCDFPGYRFLMSMGCGALVVSEPIYDSTPYKAGEHFVQASVADLPDVIVHYLENKAEREKIVSSAHNFVTKELTIQSTIKHIMGVCGADSPLQASDMRRGD